MDWVVSSTSSSSAMLSCPGSKDMGDEIDQRCSIRSTAVQLVSCISSVHVCMFCFASLSDSLEDDVTSSKHSCLMHSSIAYKINQLRTTITTFPTKPTTNYLILCQHATIQYNSRSLDHCCHDAFGHVQRLCTLHCANETCVCGFVGSFLVDHGSTQRHSILCG